MARYVEGLETRGEDIPVANIAAGFQEAIDDTLSEKSLNACEAVGADTLVVGGGFSANSRLRALLAERAAKRGITVRIPPIRYCTDNGAMIAALGYKLVTAGVAPSPLDMTVDTNMDLEQPVMA